MNGVYLFPLLPLLLAFAVLQIAQWFDKRTTKKIEQECNVLYDEICNLQFRNNMAPYSYGHFEKKLRQAKQENNIDGMRNTLEDRLKRYKALKDFKDLLESHKAFVLDRISREEELRRECIVLFEEVLELQKALGIPLYDANKFNFFIKGCSDLFITKNQLEGDKAALLDKINMKELIEI